MSRGLRLGHAVRQSGGGERTPARHRTGTVKTVTVTSTRPRIVGSNALGGISTDGAVDCRSWSHRMNLFGDNSIVIATIVLGVCALGRFSSDSSCAGISKQD